MTSNWALEEVNLSAREINNSYSFDYPKDRSSWSVCTKGCDNEDISSTNKREVVIIAASSCRNIWLLSFRFSRGPLSIYQRLLYIS